MVSWIRKLAEPEFDTYELVLPDWAQWLAQDADGVWWAYECEPNQAYSGWYENEVGRFFRLHQAKANPNWQETLRRVHLQG